jgi:Mannose-6-phosphate isomerase
MKVINSELLDKISESAQNNARLRMNLNFHQSLDSKSQRLLNALEPGTEVPVHRHLNTAESYILLRGRLKVIFYNDQMELTDSVILNPESGNFGIDIPMGQWHSIEVLESGTVIFEVKDGPYKPITEKDILAENHNRIRQTQR